VKVLDFGLAKDLGRSGPADATVTAGHTQQGIVMGTPAYMSPEQCAGRAVDHRSDIFSLGILLYQMATGQRPFGGDSSIELASAILRDTPPLVTEVRPDVPAAFARIVRRCLEKDPRDRLQTAQDVGTECRELARGLSNPDALRARGGPAEGSGAAAARAAGFRVAVLPFKARGTDPSVETLAEVITDEIVAGLSRFTYLRVIARGAGARDTTAAADVQAAGLATPASPI
jgi:eukaryotic-like serine/threonine-protein kinase